MSRRLAAYGRSRRSRFAVATILLLGLLAAAAARGRTADAHPLGNFTINRYARVEIGAGQVRVRYVADYAEIPAYQAITNSIDRNHDGKLSDDERATYLAKQLASLRDGLHVTLDGATVALQIESSDLSFPPGQGGLQTMRIEGWLTAPLPASHQPAAVDVRDDNFNDHIGWKELILRGVGGVTLQNATLPDSDASDELRSYPQDMLASPLDRRSGKSALIIDAAAEQAAISAGPTVSTNGTSRAATHSSTLDVLKGIANWLGGASTAAKSGGAFAKLITAKHVTIPLLLVYLVVAMFFGGQHALGPGHGKTIVGAYLVGTRGTARHAIFLGLTVTVTHTIGVFTLGFITLYLQQFIVPERLYPWLTLASGLLIVTMGAGLIRSRMRAMRRAARARAAAQRPPRTRTFAGALRANGYTVSAAYGHAHAGGGATPHSHGFGGRHEHTVPGADGTPVTWKTLLGLGISGGILPCPAALVVLVSALTQHRVGFGMLLILAFSVGLAGVLTGFGLALVYADQARRWLGGGRLARLMPTAGASTGSRIMRLLPVGSAFLVLAAGLMITVQTLPQAGALHP